MYCRDRFAVGTDLLYETEPLKTVRFVVEDGKSTLKKEKGEQQRSKIQSIVNSKENDFYYTRSCHQLKRRRRQYLQ